MPCMKCANGKWKYGEGGSCVFDTLAACKAAAAAIHTPSGPHQAPQTQMSMTPVSSQITENPCVDSTHEDVTHALQANYK